MAPAAIPNVIQCNCSTDFEREINALRDPISVVETEETWDNIARAITRLTALARGNASEYCLELIAALRSLSRPINSAANSERTRLSGVAIELMNVLAGVLELSFEPLIPIFMPTLLALCSRSNKVFISRSRACILSIVENSRSSSILPYLAESVKDKSTSLRLAAAESTLACLNSFNPPDLEREPRAREIEAIIRSTATDASADVRTTGRKIFEAYKVLLPHRVDSFTQPLTPTVKKYLNIKPKIASGSHSNPPSRPQSSQSLNSLQDRLSRPQLSSSTSALGKISGTRSSQNVTAHGRSASSSSGGPATSAEVKGTQMSAKSTTLARRPAAQHPQQSGGVVRKDMPPPDFVPNRPFVPSSRTGGNSRRPQATDATDIPLREGTHSDAVTAVSEPSSSTTALRPRSETLQPERHPSRPPSATGAARSLASHDSMKGLRTGPIRPTANEASMPPVRPNSTERKERVVGGARRVLILPQTDGISDAPSEPKRHVSVTQSDAAVPPSKAPAPKPKSVRAASSTRVPAERGQQSKTTKANEKARPVHTASTRATTAKPKGRIEPADRKPGGQSKSTKTQHGEKPVKANATSIGGTAQPNVRQEQETAASQPIPPELPGDIPPVDVPLPPSPTQASVPMLVPLPPSPIPKEPEEIPSVVTPRRMPVHLAHLTASEQTPISALVADIERGFLQTPYSPFSPVKTQLRPGSSLPFCAPLKALNLTTLTGQDDGQNTAEASEQEVMTIRDMNQDKAVRLSEPEDCRQALEELQVGRYQSVELN